MSTLFSSGVNHQWYFVTFRVGLGKDRWRLVKFRHKENVAKFRKTSGWGDAQSNQIASGNDLQQPIMGHKLRSPWWQLFVSLHSDFALHYSKHFCLMKERGPTSSAWLVWKVRLRLYIAGTLKSCVSLLHLKGTFCIYMCRQGQRQNSEQNRQIFLIYSAIRTGCPYSIHYLLLLPTSNIQLRTVILSVSFFPRTSKSLLSRLGETNCKS